MLILENAAGQQQAVQHLLAGDLVILPTETVYGLAARADQDEAILKIYALKKRPTFNPLILHYASLEATLGDALWNESAERLAEAFWPGPLTLVLARREGSKISTLATAGLPSLALRVPAHPWTRGLLLQLPFPLAAPSANPSGRLSPTQAGHLQGLFGEDLPIVGGAPCDVGIESTVLDLQDEASPFLLRPGALTPAMLNPYLKAPLRPPAQGVFHSPGLLPQHYAPRKSLRMNVLKPRGDEGFLTFGPNPCPAHSFSFDLSPTRDLGEAAKRFFQGLHELDQCPHIRGIAVMPLPDEGLGVALNDKLRRAQTR